MSPIGTQSTAFALLSVSAKEIGDDLPDRAEQTP